MPKRCSRSHIRPLPDQKTFCTCTSPIQSPWFSPCGDSRPLEANDRTDRRKTSQGDAAGSNQFTGFARPLSGSRRHPVIIQITFACRNPFHSSRARRPSPIYTPAPCGPRRSSAAASCGRTRTVFAVQSVVQTSPPRKGVSPIIKGSVL